MTIPTRTRVGSRKTYSFTGDLRGKISFMDQKRFSNGQDVHVRFQRRKETFSARLDSVSPGTIELINRIKGGTIQPTTNKARLVIEKIDGQTVLKTSIPVTIGSDGTSVTIHFPSQRSKAA